jgi:hypothetical protein
MTPPRTGPTTAAAVLDLLDRGNGIESCVRGDSMGATLPDGVRIRIRATRGEPCVPGDVIALSTPAGLVAHRIVARGRRGRARAYVITRGDNRVVCEPAVHEHLIGGRVVARLDADGWMPVPAARPLPAPRRQLATLALLAPSLALEVHPRLGQAVNAPVVLLARLLTRTAGALKAAAAP